MPTHPGDPLRKVTLNLYESDCVELEASYGRGWTTEVREVIRVHTTVYIRSLRLKRSATLGDIND